MSNNTAVRRTGANRLRLQEGIYGNGFFLRTDVPDRKDSPMDRNRQCRGTTGFIGLCAGTRRRMLFYLFENRFPVSLTEYERIVVAPLVDVKRVREGKRDAIAYAFPRQNQHVALAFPSIVHERVHVHRVGGSVRIELHALRPATCTAGYGLYPGADQVDFFVLAARCRGGSQYQYEEFFHDMMDYGIRRCRCGAPHRFRFQRYDFFGRRGRLPEFPAFCPACRFRAFFNLSWKGRTFRYR